MDKIFVTSIGILILIMATLGCILVSMCIIQLILEYYADVKILIKRFKDKYYD